MEAMGAVSEMNPSDRLLALTFILLVISIYIWIRTRLPLIYVKKITLRFYALLPLLSSILSFAIAAMNPVDDYYYYGGCIFCAFSAALLSVGLIKYYNLLSTRPLPSFYDREGGNNSEKY